MRFLLDENIEHEVYHRLESDGHDVLHVEISDELHEGDTDESLAAVSRSGDWIIITYDDDFRDDSDDDYRAVLSRIKPFRRRLSPTFYRGFRRTTNRTNSGGS